MCTTCKRQLLFALLQLITFVCTTAIDNILSTTPIVNFYMPYCNCQYFYGTTNFAWTIATITINIIYLELLTFKCTMIIDKYYAISQLTNFVYCAYRLYLLLWLQTALTDFISWLSQIYKLTLQTDYSYLLYILTLLTEYSYRWYLLTLLPDCTLISNSAYWI